jgi:K+-transporting ATPase c subunit
VRDFRSLGKAASPLLRTFAVLVLLLMVAYPLLMTGIGQLLFPHQANGSPIICNGTPVGSSLIAQNVSSPMLFHPRNATTEASGVDPHIAPADAYAQIPGISNATGLPASSLRYIVDQNIANHRAENLGVLAPDYVNVNEVNLDLIELYPAVYAGFCS